MWLAFFRRGEHLKLVNAKGRLSREIAHLYIAPKIFGGVGAKGPIGGEGKTYQVRQYS